MDKPPSSADLVQTYLEHNYRIVTWPAVGDSKGPREEGWPRKEYTLNDYQDGYRVGIITGHEVAAGKYLVDVDIDWAPGAQLALHLLPPTGFIYGRTSKKYSHCFYTLPEPLPSYRYEDIDKTCLLELRGTKSNGDVGLQTMAPPSIWSKEGKTEPLAFVKFEEPTHISDSAFLKQRLTYTAIGMLCAKHLGTNGFGHDARLAWAGFLLRAGISKEDLIVMGEAMSPLTNNLEVADVRRAVESTAISLASPKAKVKGGPSFARILGDKGKAVVGRINEWLGRERDFIRTQDGVIIAKNQENIRRAIELLGHELTYNEFSATMLIDGNRLEDPQWKALYLEIDREHRFQPPIDYFRMVIEDLAIHHSFHPVKQYLNALVWDGKERLDRWIIKCGGAEDTPYVRAVSSIMMIAAVRRIRQPGCKYDEMVVWESEQGADKSSAAQALCPNPEWFSDDLRLNLHAQELIEATLGKWIIEASDLAGKRKTEIEQLKAMLSRQRDGPARMAYAHFPVERARHFIIVGTTNSSAYLTDPTGGRRFWPIAVKRFNVELIKMHRDQLWAEACMREAKGESIRLSQDLWEEAGKQQEKRREVDAWEVPIRQAIMERGFDGRDGRLRVASTSLWEVIGVPPERRDIRGSVRISETMQKFGFRKVSVRQPGKVAEWGFVLERPELFETNESEDEDL